ncbi:MAG: type IV pilus assembly protein PilM [Fimbriimonadaceae bacterium]|nr:type IV pilus assembly protein PilM [Fimbriimonadaceae bacterium]
MAKRLSSVVGVDIGPSYIKVAEVRNQGGQPVVTALGKTPTPSNTVDQTGIIDPENVGIAVRQACAEAGASVGDIVLSVAGQQSVLVRTLEVPNMNEADLKAHMEWEVTRNIPFSESDVEKDYKAYPPTDAASQNMDVVMAITPRSAVNNMMALTKKAGKKAAAIDVEPLAIARVLASNYSEDYRGKSVCVVEIGSKVTAINIYRDGRLLMPRQVPIGGEMYTREIADGMGVTFEEAESIKHSQLEIPQNAGGQTYNPFDSGATMQPYNPFADPLEAGPEAAPEPAEEAPVSAPASSNAAYPHIAQVLDETVAEIRRSVDYFRGKGGEVDQILLAGGGASITGLPEFLATSLGIPVARLNPGHKVPINSRNGSEAAGDYAVAIGNGLHIFF